MTFINLIPHGNYPGLSPEGQIIAIIVALLFFLVGYGLYLTFGPGSQPLRDPIDEHAKMHELGIAHGHEGKALWIKEKGKNIEHSHPPDLLG
jgi:hypothetical protein